MAESSLDQTWQKAQDRLTEAAKQVEFNRKFKNSTELETWISDRKATGDSKWADNGLTLLNVVSKLGHVVAPGAELAFPPATVCMNGLNFLISIPLQIKKNHEVMNGVLERTKLVFDEFNIYRSLDEMKALPPAMKELIEQYLIAFVDICISCLDLLANEKKIKLKSLARHCKTIFANEDPIGTAVGRLEELQRKKNDRQNVENFHQAVSTGKKVQVLQAQSADTGDKVSTLYDSNRALKKEETRQNELNSLRNKLGVKSASQAEFSITSDENKNRVSSPSKWYKDHSEYKSWLENETTSALIVLWGNKGTGRAFAATSIFLDLKNQSAAKRSIGFYSFPSKTSKTSKSSQDSDLHLTALKCIICQRAEQDLVFAAHALKVCRNINQQTGIKDIWQKFFLDRPRTAMPFDLLLDGLDNVAENYNMSSLMNSAIPPDRRTPLPP